MGFSIRIVKREGKQLTMALSCAFCLVKWGIIIGVFVFLIHFWISSKSYLMSEKEVAAIATPYAGRSTFKCHVKKILVVMYLSEITEKGSFISSL